MNRAVSRAAALAAVLVLLAACSTPGVRPAELPAISPAAAGSLAGLERWAASGRVAIRTPADGWTASFDWREHDGSADVGVRGPFGAGAVQIARTPGSIRIDTGKGAPLEVPAPFDALEPALVERLGFPLPLEQLRWWLLGVPAPAAPSVGAPGAFDQAGWSVRAEEYATAAGAPAPLPRRLVLTREGTRIRIVVDRWELPPP